MTAQRALTHGRELPTRVEVLERHYAAHIKPGARINIMRPYKCNETDTKPEMPAMPKYRSRDQRVN